MANDSRESAGGSPIPEKSSVSRLSARYRAIRNGKRVKTVTIRRFTDNKYEIIGLRDTSVFVEIESFSFNTIHFGDWLLEPID